MNPTIKKALFNFGGYAFWILVMLWALITLVLKGLSATCNHEIVNTVLSPNGELVAEITIGDCGGATTDFFGSVNVKSSNSKLIADGLYTFVGRPESTGLQVYWNSDTEIVISISDLYKVRSINPDGRASNDLKVNYEFRQ